MKLSVVALALISLLALAPSTSSGSGAAPTGSSNHVSSLAALFSENPFTGGQVAPRSYRWATERSTIFVQFDRPTNPAALRYVGISVKGTFCAETQPGGANGGFTHFHRLDSPTYAAGHGGPPGTQGYWLLWVAVDDFAAFDGRAIKPGVDYASRPHLRPPAAPRRHRPSQGRAPIS